MSKDDPYPKLVIHENDDPKCVELIDGQTRCWLRVDCSVIIFKILERYRRLGTEIKSNQFIVCNREFMTPDEELKYFPANQKCIFCDKIAMHSFDYYSIQYACNSLGHKYKANILSYYEEIK